MANVIGFNGYFPGLVLDSIGRETYVYDSTWVSWRPHGTGLPGEHRAPVATDIVGERRTWSPEAPDQPPPSTWQHAHRFGAVADVDHAVAELRRALDRVIEAPGASGPGWPGYVRHHFSAVVAFDAKPTGLGAHFQPAVRHADGTWTAALSQRLSLDAPANVTALMQAAAGLHQLLQARPSTFPVSARRTA